MKRLLIMLCSVAGCAAPPVQLHLPAGQWPLDGVTPVAIGHSGDMLLLRFADGRYLGHRQLTHDELAYFQSGGATDDQRAAHFLSATDAAPLLHRTAGDRALWVQPVPNSAGASSLLLRHGAHYYYLDTSVDPTLLLHWLQRWH
ncbi:hypothetical protein [Isoalcanivorax beigongshangi]|uniref:Uncharacterized protein n=1 Tax=Isoalcanivorax beigongshangi TaxID=3238810 RepID=A0ABV4AG06_9GAMM